MDGSSSFDGSQRYVTKGGVELPVSIANVKLARDLVFYPKKRTGGVGSFNKVFYASLSAVGVSGEDLSLLVALLSKHRLDLGLSGVQVRGVIGLEHGVFTSKGVFTKAARAHYVEEVDRWDSGVIHGGVFSDEEWVGIHSSAIEAGRSEGMVDQSSVDDEIAWIQANDLEWPDFTTAPSRCAIKSWLRINMPDNSSLANDFTKIVWARRFASVRKAGRSEPLVVDSSEDSVVDDRPDLMSKLWGEG